MVLSCYGWINMGTCKRHPAKIHPQSEGFYYTIHMKIRNQSRPTLSLLRPYSVITGLHLGGWQDYEARVNSPPHFSIAIGRTGRSLCQASQSIVPRSGLQI